MDRRETAALSPVLTLRFAMGVVWALGSAAAALPVPDFNDQARAATETDLAGVGSVDPLPAGMLMRRRR